MDHLTKEARMSAWLILLNIDIDAKEIETLRMDYLSKYMLN